MGSPGLSSYMLINSWLTDPLARNQTKAKLAAVAAARAGRAKDNQRTGRMLARPMGYELFGRL